MFTGELKTWQCSRCKTVKPVSDFYKRSLLTRFNWCMECHKKLTKRYSSSRYVKNRNARLKELYGITELQYESMLSEQGGGCAICGTLMTARRLCVDHDHETNKVRALLCRSCNLMIGSAHDKQSVLLEAVKYLDKYEKLRQSAILR